MGGGEEGGMGGGWDFERIRDKMVKMVGVASWNRLHRSFI